MINTRTKKQIPPPLRGCFAIAALVRDDNGGVILSGAKDLGFEKTLNQEQILRPKTSLRMTLFLSS